MSGPSIAHYELDNGVNGEKSLQHIKGVGQLVHVKEKVHPWILVVSSFCPFSKYFSLMNKIIKTAKQYQLPRHKKSLHLLCFMGCRQPKWYQCSMLTESQVSSDYHIAFTCENKGGKADISSCWVRRMWSHHLLVTWTVGVFLSGVFNICVCIIQSDCNCRRHTLGCVSIPLVVVVLTAVIIKNYNMNMHFLI